MDNPKTTEYGNYENLIDNSYGYTLHQTAIIDAIKTKQHFIPLDPDSSPNKTDAIKLHQSMGSKKAVIKLAEESGWEFGEKKSLKIERIQGTEVLKITGKRIGIPDPVIKFIAARFEYESDHEFNTSTLYTFADDKISFSINIALIPENNEPVIKNISYESMYLCLLNYQMDGQNQILMPFFITEIAFNNLNDLENLDNRQRNHLINGFKRSIRIIEEFKKDNPGYL